MVHDARQGPGRLITCVLNPGTATAQTWEADSDRQPRGKVGFRTVFSHARFRNITVTSPDGQLLWDGLPNVGAGPAAPAAAANFTPLFNGKDKLGWTRDGGDVGQWEVKDGALVGTSDDYPNRCYLLTEKDYADFVLTFDFQVGDDRSHGGVALRAVPGETAPLNGRMVFDHPIIKLTNPGREAKDATGANHWLKDSTPLNEPAVTPAVVAGRWHTAVVTVRGDACTATVDGLKVVDLKLDPAAKAEGNFVPGLKRAKGRVGFQVNTGRMAYRNVAIRELPPAGTFVPLFNGKDLAGWAAEGNKTVTWAAENGALVAAGTGEGGEAGALVTTRADYRHFHLRLQVQRTTRGAGRLCLFRGAGSDNTGRYRVWLGGPNKREGFEPGRLNYDPTVVAPLVEPPPTVAVGDWYRLEVIVQGNRIRVRVNGATTADYTDPKMPAGGTPVKISIPAAGHGQFKDVEIQELPAEATLPVPQTIGFAPLFNGTDLTGWARQGNPAASWRVEKGVLVGDWPDAKDVGGGSTLVTDKADYRHFHLRLRATKSEVWGSRIFLLPSGRPDDGGGRYRVWLGSPKDAPGEEVGRLDYDAGTPTPLLAAPKVAAGDWFTLEVIVQGNRVQTLVDGAKTADFTDPQMPAAGGRIKLHLAGGGRVRFQEIAVQELPAPAAPPVPQTIGFTPLFNGKDLAGWARDGGDAKQWAVEDGALAGASDHYRSRCYLLTERDYADYTLRFEFKVGDDTAHGGVAVRAVPGEMAPLDNYTIFDHPMVKLSAPRAAKDNTGATHWLKDAAVNTPPAAAPKTVVGQWHAVEMTVRGDTCTATVDGAEVVNLRLDAKAATVGNFVPGLKRAKGRIGFQVNTGRVWYRNVMVQDLAAAGAPAPPKVEPFVPLFNGKDLTGWKDDPNPKNRGSWKVEGGVLVGRGPGKHHLYTARGDYANFHLKAEVRVNAGGNSGVYFRSTFGEGDPGRVSPAGYEAQILPVGLPADPKTGSLVHRLTGKSGFNGVLVKTAAAPAGSWFSLEVIADGKRSRILVNGKETADYTDAMYSKGHVALQVWDPGPDVTKVEFKSITIKELKP